MHWRDVGDSVGFWDVECGDWVAASAVEHRSRAGSVWKDVEVGVKRLRRVKIHAERVEILAHEEDGIAHLRWKRIVDWSADIELPPSLKDRAKTHETEVFLLGHVAPFLDG